MFFFICFQSTSSNVICVRCIVHVLASFGGLGQEAPAAKLHTDIEKQKHRRDIRVHIIKLSIYFSVSWNGVQPYSNRPMLFQSHFQVHEGLGQGAQSARLLWNPQSSSRLERVRLPSNPHPFHCSSASSSWASSSLPPGLQAPALQDSRPLWCNLLVGATTPAPQAATGRRTPCLCVNVA